MLKFFCGRASPVVYLLNFIAFIEMLYLLFEFQHLGLASGFLVFTYLFFNAINLFPFYPGTKGKLGIRLHFQKNMVPTVYISVLFFSLKLIGFGEAIFWIAAILYLPMYYVVFILLYFHCRDSSTMVPGYFSHNFYLDDEDPTCTHSPS